MNEDGRKDGKKYELIANEIANYLLEQDGLVFKKGGNVVKAARKLGYGKDSVYGSEEFLDKVEDAIYSHRSIPSYEDIDFRTKQGRDEFLKREIDNVVNCLYAIDPSLLGEYFLLQHDYQHGTGTVLVRGETEIYRYGNGNFKGLGCFTPMNCFETDYWVINARKGEETAEQIFNGHCNDMPFLDAITLAEYFKNGTFDWRIRDVVERNFATVPGLDFSRVDEEFNKDYYTEENLRRLGFLTVSEFINSGGRVLR